MSHNVTDGLGRAILAQGVFSGRKEVTTAGTPEPLGASTLISRVVIQALPSNTGAVCVGGADISAPSVTRNGISLLAGDSFAVNVYNLANVYLDVEVSGEGVSYVYFK